MELSDDLVVEIISHLPLKLAVQCKVLNKNFNIRISDSKFSQTLYQHQKTSSTLLVYGTSNGFSQQYFHKISINPTATIHCETTLPFDVLILASCKGLLLLNLCKYPYRFEDSILCVFNPLTGARQLIQYPERPDEYFEVNGGVGLAVDYPTSNQYKLVMIGKRTRDNGHKFFIFSSEGSDGMWHEVQMRMTFFGYLYFPNRPVYVHDSMHWLRSDCGVVAFDTKTEEDTILNPPEFINHHDPIGDNMYLGLDIWLGEMQGLLTLICIFKKSTVIATYDFERSYWRVSHTFPNFIKGLDRYHPYGIGYPVWIKNKHPLFVLDCKKFNPIQFIYECDPERNRYNIIAVFDKDDHVNLPSFDMPSFSPTLASVHKTFSTTVDTIDTELLSAITATLDELKRFITDGTG